MPRTPDSLSKDAIYCAAMLDDIERELADVASFTRDDLMYLPTFQHVATITRYYYVGMALRYALDTRKILEVARWTYILAGRKKQYTSTMKTHDEFDSTVMRMVRAVPPGVYINVPRLLGMWTSDQYLSTSSKRTVLREVLKQLVRREVIEEASFGQYIVKQEVVE